MKHFKSQRGISLIEVMIASAITLIIGLSFAELMRQQQKQVKVISAQQESNDLKNSLFRNFRGQSGGGACCPIGKVNIGDVIFSPAATSVGVNKIYSNCTGTTEIISANGKISNQQMLKATAVTLDNIQGAGNVFSARLNVKVETIENGLMQIRPVQINMGLLTETIGGDRRIIGCNADINDESAIDYTQCKETIKWYGRENPCDTGYALIGFCGSGENADCRLGANDGYTISVCCKVRNFTQNGCYWKSGGYGSHLTCNPGEIVTGVCGSGKNPDCQGSFHKIQCCSTAAVNPKVTNYQCKWHYGWYGETVNCPSGYIVKGACGSGRNPDCRGAFTGRYCCPAD
jgi:type II secretory pathway pseudopilin PulG